MVRLCAQFIIYGLVDPRSGAIRYIGKSTQGITRCNAHRVPRALAKDRSYKANWIRSLNKIGLTYVVELLEEMPDGTSGEAHDAAEIAWIAHGHAEGWRLTNHTKGGDGMLGHRLPAAARAKIGEANRRRVVTDETKAKIREYRTGRPSPETSGDKNPSRTRRERMPRGTGHWKSKLTNDDVASIKRRRSDGETQVSLAKEFHVSGATLSRVVNGETYSSPADRDAARSRPKRKYHKSRLVASAQRNPKGSGSTADAVDPEPDANDMQ